MATATIPTDHSIRQVAVYLTAGQLDYFTDHSRAHPGHDLVITATDDHGGIRVELATNVGEGESEVWVDALGVERQLGSSGAWASSTVAAWVLARLERVRGAHS